MSTVQRLTLIGMNDVFGEDLWEFLELPDGYYPDLFLATLLMEHGEKCVLYTNPAFFKNAVMIWCGKWWNELERIYAAMTVEYNPIHNYDRYEEYEDNEGIDRGFVGNSTHTAKDSPKYDDDVTNDYDIVNKQDFDGTTEHKVSADNSSDYQPESKDITNAGQSTMSNDGTIKRHVEGDTQNLEEWAGNVTTENTDRKLNHDAHLYGNIGVTTSVQMWTEEVRARAKYNMYGIAAGLFANELLIGIF